MTTPTSTSSSAASEPPRNRKSAKPDDASAPMPRKRRRRAVGSGAAEDCFTCASRQVSCDRRRPYCTPCLELGGRCSGYKTTLTWGVGVASRGKLRGLSLPVSGSQKVSAFDSQTPQPKGSEEVADPAQALDRIDGSEPPFAPLMPPSSTTLHTNTATWASAVPTVAVPTTAEDDTISPVSSCGYQHPTSTPVFHGVPAIPQSTHVSSYPNIDELANQQGCSSAETVATPTDSAGIDPFYPTLWAHSAPAQACAPPPSPPVSDQPLQVRANCPRKHVADSRSAKLEDNVNQSSPNSSEPGCSSSDDGPQSSARHTSMVHQPLWSQMVGQTPRMRYLIGYYMEVIAPVIVAFDTPTNPFRMYMMELAKTSESLQHAIATLSLSNLRQRRKNWGLSTGKTLPSRRSCQAHCRLTDQSLAESFGLLSPDEQMKEEMLHKAIVIQSVNVQLADPIARRTDALLATLLVLSIFYMCDTGMASFKSQFAGVRKLFALRKNSRQSNSEVTKWFMRIFTWFDTMTAAVNDRDSELSADYLDQVTETGDEWSLENLAGCDSRLFRLIGQLSRLNQLSQLKPVEPTETVGKPVPTVAPPASMVHYPSFSPPTFPNGDFISFSHDIPFNAYQHSDPRTEFWQEWRAMRQRLESWRLGLPDHVSTTSVDPSTPSSTPTSAHGPSFPSFPQTPQPPTSSLAHVSPANLPDVSNISECFRYSGLLYLERLAHPHLPSSHPRIQNLVYGALHYINAVQSDVFLLWPLFITGAECVLEADRQIIRQRCGDIQKDSGFVNNLSCLQLLEKIWASESNLGAPAFASDSMRVPVGLRTASELGYMGNAASMGQSATNRDLLGGEGFKWRRIIDAEKMNQEYIVV
ncbi:hypothetical protein PRK78_002375 [Emydomyces testavorans]|uniref:Zn(2)-C6 fungal-type domain-containing protein n=1 Tax=Emydomyces testavorans TaxID=2070801 RepID=A0AAF0DER1_9EURO|nr:hypothetical protein PRK78_002375 [Emydomyces testavorans]